MRSACRCRDVVMERYDQSPTGSDLPDEMFFFPQFRYKSDLMGMRGTGWLALSSPQIESAKKAGELISEVPPTCLYCDYGLVLTSFCRGNLLGGGGAVPKRAPWPLNSQYSSRAICSQIPKGNKLSLQVNSLLRS